MADYCVYWIRKAHDHLPACTAADPVAGRAGLVGTQNIRNNQSRVGGLDHVVKERNDFRSSGQSAVVRRGKCTCFHRKLGENSTRRTSCQRESNLWFKVAAFS